MVTSPFDRNQMGCKLHIRGFDFSATAWTRTLQTAPSIIDDSGVVEETIKTKLRQRPEPKDLVFSHADFSCKASFNYSTWGCRRGCTLQIYARYMYYLQKHIQLLPGYQAGEPKNPANLSNTERASERARREKKDAQKPDVCVDLGSAVGSGGP